MSGAGRVATEETQRGDQRRSTSKGPPPTPPMAPKTEASVLGWGRGLPLSGGLCCHRGNSATGTALVKQSLGGLPPLGAPAMEAPALALGRGLPMSGGLCCHRGNSAQERR